jgi:hypothetical protein
MTPEPVSAGLYLPKIIFYVSYAYGIDESLLRLMTNPQSQVAMRVNKDGLMTVSMSAIK